LGQAEPRLPAMGERATEQGGGEGAGELEARALRTCGLIGELIERFDGAYAERKHASTTLDFDDLELSARSLLQRRVDVREAWAERFDLLMVDEFQDSSPRQLQVLAALDRDNLFTVGDELQSIYGFRHADVGLFRERRGLLAERGASLALTRNFRSRPAILAAVERIFAHRMGGRFTSLSAARAPHEDEAPIVELLLTDKRGWEPLPGDEDLRGMPEATPWRQAEARLLAGRIAELIAAGRPRRERSSSCCVPSAMFPSTRAPCAVAGCPPWPACGASGAISRSETCLPGCARSPTPSTSWRSTRRLPRPWWGPLATPLP